LPSSFTAFPIRLLHLSSPLSLRSTQRLFRLVSFLRSVPFLRCIPTWLRLPSIFPFLPYFLFSPMRYRQALLLFSQSLSPMSCDSSAFFSMSRKITVFFSPPIFFFSSYPPPLLVSTYFLQGLMPTALPSVPCIPLIFFNLCLFAPFSF